MAKRSPFDIHKSTLIGWPAANAEETAERVRELWGGPAQDEEDLLFNTTVLDADIDPMSESVQRPKRHG